jgi:FkbM family methyltransferase
LTSGRSWDNLSAAMGPLNDLRQLARTHLPARIQHALKKLYYPRVLRRFTEDRWPYGSAVRRILRPGDRAVDVGANIGYVTMLLSEWVGPQGRVYSFEPVPDTFDLLRHNVRALDLRNVELSNCGLSSSEREAWMRIPNYSNGGENLYEARIEEGAPGGAEGRVVNVRLRRLDDILPADEPVRFVKIDAEGHEREVLHGAERLVSRCKPVLLIEVAGNPDQADTPAASVFELLCSCGYRPMVLEGDKLTERRAGMMHSDYLFVQHVDYEDIEDRKK